MNTVIPIHSGAEWESPDLGIIGRYWAILKNVLFEPTRFFRNSARNFTVSEALSFGLVTLWLSHIVSFIWGTANKLVFYHFVESWLEGATLGDESGLFAFTRNDFLANVGFLLLQPFFSLLSFASFTLVLLTFGRLLVADERTPERTERIRFREILRVLAFSAAGSVLYVVPIFGGLLAFIAVVLLALIGLREVLQITTKQAALVIFVPQILLFLLFIMVMALAVLVFSLVPLDQLMDFQSGAGQDEMDSLLRIFHIF